MSFVKDWLREGRKPEVHPRIESEGRLFPDHALKPRHLDLPASWTRSGFVCQKCPIKLRNKTHREDDMGFSKSRLGTRAATAASAFALSLALTAGVAQAQDKAIVMKITTPTLNAALDLYAKQLAIDIEKDTGGRIKVEVYPASQLGSIPRQIEGTQFGAIQCAIIPPEFFVGIDERFEVLAAPGLVTSIAQGQKVAADPAVEKFYLGLGADKGLHGVAVAFAEPSEVISKNAIRHIADFKGKKLRIFASEFQSAAFKQLGTTPVAMSPGDVMTAIQQGSLDSSVAGVQLLSGLHFYDAAKYITVTDHAAIFYVVELSKKWFDSLPADLQQIVEKDASKLSVSFNPRAIEIENAAIKTWTDNAGELIKLPADEQAEMLKEMSGTAVAISKEKPALAEAYKIVTDAAQRSQ
jgi:TRAP-type C4-dicarboxylate transport system substrate-binding protein